MDTRDDTVGDACLLPSNASPPDFDFNIPCRFFKSSFARSLSLNNANSNGSSNQCKSLDYDLRCNNNSNKLSFLKRDVTAVSAIPPIPQRSSNQSGSFYQQNEDNITSEHNNKKQVYADTAVEAVLNEENKPPALPSRRPLSLHNLSLHLNSSVNECQMNAEQKYQQNILTQLRQQAFKQVTNTTNNNSIMPVNGNNKNNNNYTDHSSTGLQLSPRQHQPALNLKTQPHHFTASSNKNATTSCNSSCINNNNKNNFRRNNNNDRIVRSKQQKNLEQDYNICTFDQANEDIEGVEINSNTTKLSTANNFNNHFHNSHNMFYAIPTINVHNNQQQQQQSQSQQNQQQHHTSTYEILNDTTTNVEALILQNQVDTLQWQLKQVETSCDMYRAVMEEVARFLERYQNQKQLQQQQLQQQQLQQQQQKQQMQQQMTTHNKDYNNSSKLEQIPRSKSLFQVYIAGGHDKSTAGNNELDDTSLKPSTATGKSYMRARSSTNLIDIKPQPLNSNYNGKSKELFESSLLPPQSYSAFKDFTWRRSPKKADSRLSIGKTDVEEKLNQEAFRLLRTIQNLLNTSQYQPDLTHNRLSLESAASSQMGRLSTISSISNITLPGAPIHNSSSSTIGANSNGSLASDSSHTSPINTTTTANNSASNNLAPEMPFLRSTKVRDSRLSLRSSTDSSVHSTSSAASSGSSKVETDEETTTPFHPPPNIHTHKQHQHLAGSSTEDESGFSSISSFPDFGVSLNSKLLSKTNSSDKSRSVDKELKYIQTNENDSPSGTDSRNSTLKANIVGLPLSSSHDMSHRWDSSSKTYHNPSNKFQKFSALTNEDSNSVLWV